MVWALENACQQNCGPWQFYGWFWHSEEETAQVSNINGFIIKFGLWYYSWLSFSISLTTKHVEKHMQLPNNDQYVLYAVGGPYNFISQITSLTCQRRSSSISSNFSDFLVE